MGMTIHIVGEDMTREEAIGELLEHQKDLFYYRGLQKDKTHGLAFRSIIRCIEYRITHLEVLLKRSVSARIKEEKEKQDWENEMQRKRKRMRELRAMCPSARILQNDGYLYP